MWQHLMVYPPIQSLFEEIRTQGTQLEDKHQARSLLQEVLASVNDFAVRQNLVAPIDEFARATIELLKTVSLKVMDYVTKTLKVGNSTSGVAESISEPIKIILLTVKSLDLTDGGLASQWCKVIISDWAAIESSDVLFSNHKLIQQILDFSKDLIGRLNKVLFEHKLSEMDLCSFFSHWEKSVKLRTETARVVEMYQKAKVFSGEDHGESAKQVEELSLASSCLKQLTDLECEHREHVWPALKVVSEGLESGDFIAQLTAARSWIDDTLEASYDTAIGQYKERLLPQLHSQSWGAAHQFLPSREAPAGSDALKAIAQIRPDVAPSSKNISALIHMAQKFNHENDRITLEAMETLERCRVYGAHLLLCALPALPASAEQVATPAGFSKCSVNSQNLKQLIALKEFADVYDHLAKAVEKHRSDFDKEDFATSTGAACMCYVLFAICKLVRCVLSGVGCVSLQQSFSHFQPR